MIDYHVIPELEQHLHKLIKRIHSSMDKLPEEEEQAGVYNAKDAEEALLKGTNLDILERSAYLKKENLRLRQSLEQSKIERKKYLTTINRLNHEITDYVERIGRLFILKTVVPY